MLYGANPAWRLIRIIPAALGPGVYSGSNRDILLNRARMMLKAENLTAICEPTVQTTWDPQHFVTLWASTACYEDSLVLLLLGL
jgi:hypothetical protein